MYMWIYIYNYIQIVMLLQAKSKLQLRLTHNEHLVAPRERVEPRSPEVSPEAVAAMAKRLVERTRKDLEAQMAVTWKKKQKFLGMSMSWFIIDDV